MATLATIPRCTLVACFPVVVGAAFYYLYHSYHCHTQMMKQLYLSQRRARVFYTTLNNLIHHYQLQDDLGIPDSLNDKGFSFRLRNIGGGRRTILLSFPSKYNRHPHFVEIMLLKNNKPHYDERLEYENVKVVEMGTPFVRELNRLKRAPEWDV